MISSVSKGGFTLKLGVRAMKALERTMGDGDGTIVDVLAELDVKPSIHTMTEILKECLNDGRGGSMEEADEAFDAIGFDGFHEVVSGAFPESESSDGVVAAGVGGKKKKAAPAK